eukprot:1140943-Pelagomonas_calceolata.AAC.2
MPAKGAIKRQRVACLPEQCRHRQVLYLWKAHAITNVVRHTCALMQTQASTFHSLILAEAASASSHCPRKAHY